LALALLAGCTEPGPASPNVPPWAGPGEERLVHETRSDFSHIRVRDHGSVRTLYFVRDTGKEAIETSIDLKAPHLLLVPYTRIMFASYLFRAEQKSCLIVGLGGGSMVHFINRFFPDLRVDAVEIDPVVVEVAARYFGTKPGGNNRIFTEDAFRYLERTKDRYDVIYMDAFLKPGEDTDAAGVPLHLKTVAFFKSLHANLKEGGLVLFNLNVHPGTDEDLRAIREAFPQVYVFAVPKRHNFVVVGSLVSERVPRAALEACGAAMDAKADFGFSLREMVGQLRD